MQEKVIKFIPALLFLFYTLGVFELVLIIEDMNKTEKLEIEIKKNLAVIETIVELLNDHLEGMQEQQEQKIKLNKAR
ncbi:hypothetical protein JT175_07170 [Helicobacter pylori]|nr:hypothetical protein [Helicobacter phage FrB58M]MCQ2834762.1 hypothetical protein [Helicobacter pylori]